jgi:hypothetical protein
MSCSYSLTQKLPRRALPLFCKLDQGIGFILFNKTEKFLMRHTSFKHRQTRSYGQFLPGGKVGVFVRSKRAKSNYVHGHNYGHWPSFELGYFQKKFSCCKSFEDTSYDNTTNQHQKHWSNNWQPQIMATGHNVFYRGGFLEL